MTHQVDTLPAAHQDSWRIYRILVKKSESGADRWYQAFLDAVRELADRPERRALAPEAKRVMQPIRQKFFKTPRGMYYRLIYLVSNQEVRAAPRPHAGPTTIATPRP